MTLKIYKDKNVFFQSYVDNFEINSNELCMFIGTKNYRVPYEHVVFWSSEDGWQDDKTYKGIVSLAQIIKDKKQEKEDSFKLAVNLMAN